MAINAVISLTVKRKSQNLLQNCCKTTRKKPTKQIGLSCGPKKLFLIVHVSQREHKMFVPLTNRHHQSVKINRLAQNKSMKSRWNSGVHRQCEHCWKLLWHFSICAIFSIQLFALTSITWPAHPHFGISVLLRIVLADRRFHCFYTAEISDCWLCRMYIV